MTVGCKLSEDTMEALREVFTECGLMPDALNQMDAALNGPNRYKNQPWDFNSKGLFDTMEESSGSGGMNVASPGGLFGGPDTR